MKLPEWSVRQVKTMNDEMRTRILRWISRIGWPVFGILLALLLWAALGEPYAVTPQSTRLPQLDERDFSSGPSQPLPAYLEAVQRREMFRQSVIYEVKKKNVVDLLGGLSYLGVVQQGGTKRAFITNTKSGQSTFYSVNEALGDLEIQAIQEDRVIFRHGNETLELIR